MAAEEWLSAVAPGDFVVFIDYFGFNLWSDWGAEVRRRGAWKVKENAGIPVFDVDAVPALLDWRI